jgi:hypothetical protein
MVICAERAGETSPARCAGSCVHPETIHGDYVCQREDGLHEHVDGYERTRLTTSTIVARREMKTFASAVETIALISMRACSRVAARGRDGEAAKTDGATDPEMQIEDMIDTPF